MMIDSSPSHAETATAARGDALTAPVTAEQSDEDVGALAALLADPSTVSSDEDIGATIPVASLQVEKASALRSSHGDSGPDEPRDAEPLAVTALAPVAGLDSAASEDGRETPPLVTAKQRTVPAREATPESQSVQSAEDTDSLSAPAGQVESHGCESIDLHVTHGFEDATADGDELSADVILLPDLSGMTAAEAVGGFNGTFLRGIADTGAVSLSEVSQSNDTTSTSADESQCEDERDANGTPAALVAGRMALPNVTAPDASDADDEAGAETARGRSEEGASSAGARQDSSGRPGASTLATEPAFADALPREIANGPAVSSDGEGPTAEPPITPSAIDGEDQADRPENEVAAKPYAGGEPILDASGLGDEAGPKAGTAGPDKPPATAGALPDSTGHARSATPAAEPAFAGGLLRTIVEASSVSSDQAGAVEEASLAAVVFADEYHADRPVAAPPGDGGSENDAPNPNGESGLETEHSSPEEAADSVGALPGFTGRARSATPAAEPAFADALLRGIADGPAVSSDEDGPTAEPSVTSDALYGENPEDRPEAEVAAAPPVGANPAPDYLPPVGMSDLPNSPVEGAGGEYGDIPLAALPPGTAAALAFATDMDTEVALRDGLFGYESPSPDCADPQVWQGGLRAAIAALSEGHSAPLILVDIDGIAYPAGAIHELAAVCDVGTAVVAIGSDDSARPGRDLLLAGVSDYLAKPLSADAVRMVAERVASDEADVHPGGSVAGFVGSGGSGATTLVTLAALHAASRGCYVTVLDLNRSVAAAALALGVEPSSGLDQLLEASAQDRPEPEMVEGVCARRSDRIEVLAHRWSPATAAAATPAAVDRLLATLRQRSQLVLVDGFDEPSLRFSPSAALDARVLVAEPLAGKAAVLPRMVDMLGTEMPLVFVQNHTRPFRRGRGARALRDAGLGTEPDVLVPFEPSLPGTADRGWPQDWLPRSLRKPVAALTDRLLGSPAGVGTAVRRPGSGES